ncbi:hypothetical protein I7I48_07084 [Histoplasma ohiense]|nr:hypothetical protein I7I48_07084 [Histoplasma ohiense (nom. inval.)]
MLAACKVARVSWPDHGAGVNSLFSFIRAQHEDPRGEARLHSNSQAREPCPSRMQCLTNRVPKV